MWPPGDATALHRYEGAEDGDTPPAVSWVRRLRRAASR